MKLVAIAAFLAVCGAAKLDHAYLPPPSAVSAGGSSDSLQAPFSRSSSSQNEYSDSLPTGSYTNNFDGVVIDADIAGIRASPDGNQSGLGGPRESYGSENSKVGEAAFKNSVAGFRTTPNLGGSGFHEQISGIAGQNFGTSERPQAFKDRNSNIITYANDVSKDNYSYGFESDNGIAVGENGVSNNGIQAQGGYSYKGDDGQVYKVTYVADEGGYRPQGDHLPTPPPIPKEILESLEQNAKEEAAGIVDDGSYDAQKYNAEGDYTHHNGGNIQYNGAQVSQFAKRPESDASNTLINQNSQSVEKPGHLGNIEAQNTHSTFDGPSNQYGSNFVYNQNSHTGSKDKLSGQIMNVHQQSSSTNLHSSGHFEQHPGSHFTSQFGQSQGSFESQSAQFGSQNDQLVPSTEFGSLSTQSGSQVNQQGSAPQLEGIANQVGSASQFETHPGKPSFGQVSNPVFNSQENQGTQFGNQVFKPQGSYGSSIQAQNSFGQSSQYNGDKQKIPQFSQTPFGNAGSNKPLFSTFDFNKPSAIGQGQTLNNNGNRFPNTPSRFGAEYLPPLNSNDKSPYNKPQTNDVSSSQNSNKKDQTPDFTSLEEKQQGAPQGSSASAFASVGSAGFEPQPVNTAFQTQSFKPNQFNYNNNNNLPASHGQTELNVLPTSSQQSGSNAVPTIASGEKPTSVPETELTTPLESYEKPDVTQGSQFNSQSLPSFGSFGTRPLNNEAKPQISLQSNIAATQQSTSQTSTSTFPDSRPQGTSQFGFTPPTLSAFSATQEVGSNKEKTQFPQTLISQNRPNYAYDSTQKPSFIQGPGDSYYYNQPSKPFGIPAFPQSSRFPSSPSYQSNGVTSSQNNQFPNQGFLTGSTKFPSSVASTVSTPSLQLIQNQDSTVTNYYNGITQASISSFPSVSPTTSTQYGATQVNKYGSKPISNQPSVIQPQSNTPINSQQHSVVPSFPSNTVTNFGQNPLTTNKLPPASPSFPSNPTTSSGQSSSTSFSQNKIQYGQSSLTNSDQPQTSGTSQKQQTTQTQEYQGTIYEYNKPAQVFITQEPTDTSSSQSIQTNFSLNRQESQEPYAQEPKPQFGSQNTQFGQGTLSSQSQQSSFNQGSKPQYGSQTFKPFGALSSNTINAEFGHNTQTTLQQSTQGSLGSVQPVKPNQPLVITPQFGQSAQVGLGSRPGSSYGPLQFEQNTQQLQGTSHTSSFTATQQTQGSQSGAQPSKPFGGVQSSTTQFGQNTQSSFGSFTAEQNSGSQFATQQNKPFGSAYNPSLFGQAAQSQGSQTTGFTSTQNNAQSSQIGAQPSKPLGTTGSTQDAKPIKPFGNTGTSQVLQGYPSSSKPQFGTQFTQTQSAQSFQQTFGATQISSQPSREPEANTLPAKPFGNILSIHGSPDSQKPQFSQNTQLNQDSQHSGSSFGQQSLQSSQFGSLPSKPQFGTQTQFGQNQNASPIKPLGSTSGQTQFVQNPAQASSFPVTQQQPQVAQANKPFGASSTQSTSFQPQNKPQFDQAPQSSQGASISSTETQFQPVKPFSEAGAKGSLNKPQDLPNKPFVSQQGSSCCQGSKGSSIIPLNVGKPSQAFAQTQSQFAGFQGTQNLNAQNVAGKGEEFNGPRQPPSFDAQTGYHY